MKYFFNFLRIIVGALFMFSGFVKLVDPIGMSFKMEEYFSPAVFDMPFFDNLSLAIALLLIFFELLLGLFLLFGIAKKFSLWSILFLMIFFTFLTFYSAYYNKVTDCGCFGDAIKLTPWQSFSKDIVLTLLVVVLLFGQRYIKPLFDFKYSLPIVFISFIWFVMVASKGINNLPIIDFRPYAEGKNIKQGMMSPSKLGLKGDKYRVVYKLKNEASDEELEVSDEQYISNEEYWKQGTSWQIIDTERRLLERGYQPPIKDFSVDCGADGDRTKEILDEEYLVVFTSYDNEKIDKKGLEKLNKLYLQIKDSDLGFVAFFSDENNGADFPTCKTDQTVLKTIIRSNPGVVLLHKGTVIKKYHWRSVGSAQSIANQFLLHEK